MAKIGKATIELGDYLRDAADAREGAVTAVEGDDITLSMGDGSVRTVPAGQLRYNSWDPKAQPDLDSANDIFTRAVTAGEVPTLPLSTEVEPAAP